MPSFLPALLRRPTAVPALTATGAALARREAKTLLSDYYNALATHGMGPQAYGASARNWSVERAVVEGYERIVWVWKPVEVIAGSQARLPLVLRDGKTVLEPGDDPLMDLLGDGKANPLESGRVLRKRLSAQILLSKRGAFVERTVSRGGRVLRYDLLPPGRTEPVAGGGADLLDRWVVTGLNGTRREVDPERVLWFRNPHPLDPYAGTTPLEAAGMSVELDYFARLYNVTFLRNDGRPGGVLGVDGEMDDDDADRVEARFGKGPAEAGKLSVINGKLTYVDLAVRPRDMAYAELATSTKLELLNAFGVPESLMGNASGSTFANAGQEGQNFWLVDPMPDHLSVVSSGFAGDAAALGLTLDFDLSRVPAVEAVAAARREELRAEVNAGLRSIDEYRAHTDDLEPLDNAFSRALYMQAGKSPIPAREEDMLALGLAPAEEAAPAEGAPPPGAEGSPGAFPVEGPQGVVAEAGSGAEEGPPPEPGAGPTGPPIPAQPSATRQSPPPRQAPGQGPAAAALAAARGGEVKSAQPRGRRPRVTLRVVTDGGEVKADPDEAVSDVDTAEVDAAEATLAAALTAAAEVQATRVRRRLTAPKTRKGTRHWQPEYPVDTRVGDTALDTARIVDETVFVAEVAERTGPLIELLAAAAAVKLLADFGVPGAPTVAAAGLGLVGLPVWLADALTEGLADVVALAAGSTARQARALAAALNEADQDGLSLDDMRGVITVDAGWANGLATQLATATAGAARDTAAGLAVERLPGSRVYGLWRSRRDDRVRPTHREAEGQLRPLGRRFAVGDALLRYPGDPLGPPREVAGCRCLRALRLVRVATGEVTPLSPSLQVSPPVRGGMPRAAAGR